jgi:3-methyladenine DNA glycosylase AlkC
MAPNSESNDDTVDGFSSKVAPELYVPCVEPTYAFNRQSAHDKRQHRSLFLRAEVSHALDDVHNTLSSEFDQSVYNADTGELLIMLALRHLDELPEVAADIGLGVSLEEAVTRAGEE